MKITLLASAALFLATVKISGQVGINTDAPNSTFVVEGSYEGAYREVSTDTSLTNSDQYVNVTGPSNTILTLPDATVTASFSGRVYSIKNSSDGTVTIAGNTASQLLRTGNNSIANTIILTPGSSVRVIKNNYISTASPLWEVFDQTTIKSNSGLFQIGETKSARIVVSATTFITNSGTRNIMTGRSSAATTNRRGAYEILNAMGDATQLAKFIVINGLRLDFIESGANNGDVSAKLFNTNSTAITYSLSALSTADSNPSYGGDMSINTNHYSYNIDGNDDMSCRYQGAIEYVNVMLTFPNGEWYLCTWHATRDTTSYYFYTTAQRLN